jgi:hypothetical protein
MNKKERECLGHNLLCMGIASLLFEDVTDLKIANLKKKNYQTY